MLLRELACSMETEFAVYFITTCWLCVIPPGSRLLSEEPEPAEDRCWMTDDRLPR